MNKIRDVSKEFAPIKTHINFCDSKENKDRDYVSHPRKRWNKTRNEFRANPNRESDRKSRQWQRAVDSAMHTHTYRHK